MNKILAMILCFVLAVFAFPISALADDIDISQRPNLEILFRDGEKPLCGAKFDVFLVAELDSSGNYYPKEEFSVFSIKDAAKSSESWRELALTLEAYVQKEEIEPYISGETDENGRLSFEKDFVCGIYLVVGYAHRQDGFVYYAETAVIQLPTADSESGKWNYNVTVKPKYSVKPETEEETFVERKVIKIWDDKGFEAKRPKEIRVFLLRDGELFDTVILSSENNWRYTWKKLDDDYRWTVAEESISGYSPKIEKEGITFVITNTFTEKTPLPETPEEPDDPSLPQTGQLWWPVPVMAFLGLLFIATGIIRKRGSR